MDTPEPDNWPSEGEAAIQSLEAEREEIRRAAIEITATCWLPDPDNSQSSATVSSEQTGAASLEEAFDEVREMLRHGHVDKVVMSMKPGFKLVNGEVLYSAEWL